MADVTIHEEFRVDNVLTDLDATCKLSDVTETYGVKRNDTSAVVVADNTTFDTHVSTGIYEHTFTEPALNLNYTYVVEWVYGGQTYRDSHVISLAAVAANTLTDLKNICKYHGWNNTTTAGETALTRFINRTLYLLSVLAPWPEYHKRDGRITLADADEDYVCTDDSDATITDISKIGSVMRTDRFTPIDLMTGGIDEWMEKSKLKPRSGSPTEYTFRKYVDSSGLIRMEMLVYPKPGSGQDGDYLYYPYWLLPTQLVNASDATDWPNYRLWLLEEALERRLASGKRDNMAVALEAPEFMLHVQKAMADSRTSYMPLPVTEQVDIRRRSIREAPIQITTE